MNDMETELSNKGLDGIGIDSINIRLLLYADDIILFGKTPDELQRALAILEEYYNRWKLTVNTSKTKIMVFRKGGRLPNNLNFLYKDSQIEILNKFSYLGVLFTSGGSNFELNKSCRRKA